MKWYSINKYYPGKTGDQIIFRLPSGYIHAGVLDYQKDKGYFFENHSGDTYSFHEITHFLIPDPFEIE